MRETKISSRKLEIPRDISRKDGHNKGQKWYGSKEAEEIKKRWKEYIGELSKKGLNELNNHDGAVTNLAWP